MCVWVWWVARMKRLFVDFALYSGSAAAIGVIVPTYFHCLWRYMDWLDSPPNLKITNPNPATCEHRIPPS